MRPYILISLLSFSISTQATDTKLWKRVETWDVRIDPSLNNGCFILNTYEPGSIRLGFNKLDETSYLIIYVRDWKYLDAGKEYEIEVEFDNKGRWKANASAVAMNGTVALRASVVRALFFKEFSEAEAMKVFYKSSEILTLSLSGSSQAMNEMIACQETM